MKKGIKITLSIIVVIVFLFLLLTFVFSGGIGYHTLAFSASCEEKCFKEGFLNSECVIFPSVYLPNVNNCGESGVDFEATSDCRTPGGTIGGYKHCCCSG
jgi:hypothetical protein